MEIKGKKMEWSSSGAVETDSGDESYIGDTVKIKGDLTSGGVIIISGVVTGNISTKKKIILKKGCKIRGRLNSKIIEIFGEVRGKVKSDGKVTLFSSGNLNGDIESETIVVKEGAIFNGNSTTLK